MKLKGRVALVTGGAKRIGRAVALGLASRGCHVAITYHSSKQEALQTVRMIRAHKVRSAAFQVDQRSGSEVRRAVEEIRKIFRHIDVLVNNASAFYPTNWSRVTDAQWNDLLSANLSGPWYFAQAVAPRMKRQGHGKIVNITDVSVESPWVNFLPYCVAKGGLTTLTKGLAKALAPEVQVNAVAPGPILFPPGLPVKEQKRSIQRTLLKRCGDPKDIVQAILFFLEGSDDVTGVIVPVDGGRRLA